MLIQLFVHLGQVLLQEQVCDVHLLQYCLESFFKVNRVKRYKGFYRAQHTNYLTDKQIVRIESNGYFRETEK